MFQLDVLHRRQGGTQAPVRMLSEASCLRQDICDLRRPGTRVSDVHRSDVNKNVPFAVQYACRYWVYHLERSDVDPQEHHGIAEFFEARFLFWLEALALMGRLADGIAILQRLETRLPVGLPDPYSFSQQLTG